MNLPDPESGDYSTACHFAIMENVNLTVPWYLACSLAYYVHDVSLISDSLFDTLCKMLMLHWHTVEHRHKALIDFELLRAGTGYSISFVNLPLIVQSSTMQMVYHCKQR